MSNFDGVSQPTRTGTRDPGPPLTTGPLADAVRAMRGASGEGAAPPGALLAVTHGETIGYAAAGDAVRPDAGAATPMQWGVRTDAGSVTKVIATTASVARLVDAGELALGDRVGRFLPRCACAGATVADLLEHRAGLREWWPLYVDGSRGAAALESAMRLPLRYPVGAGRHYSDLGFVLLGEIVARVGAQPLRQAVDRLALEPFGLGETRFAAPAPGGPVAASSRGDAIERAMVETGVPYPVEADAADFRHWRTHVLVGEVNDGNAFHAFGGVAGHAGLFTTAADLLRFGHGLLASRAGSGPIGAATARRLMTPGTDPGQAPGLRVWPGRGGPAFGHTGFPGVAFAVLPERDAAVALVTNRLHVRGTPRSGEQLWLRALDAARAHLDGRTGDEAGGHACGTP